MNNEVLAFHGSSAGENGEVEGYVSLLDAVAEKVQVGPIEISSSQGIEAVEHSDGSKSVEGFADIGVGIGPGSIGLYSAFSHDAVDVGMWGAVSVPFNIKGSKGNSVFGVGISPSGSGPVLVPEPWFFAPR